MFVTGCVESTLTEGGAGCDVAALGVETTLGAGLSEKTIIDG